MKRLLMLLAAIALAGCARGPEPIRWGVDACDQCRMVFSDHRFGAEIVGARVLKFDGVDELGRYERDHDVTGRRYVLDADTGKWLPIETATFLASGSLHGPMGGDVLAFADVPAAEAYARREKLVNAHVVALAAALEQKELQNAEH
ncbi:MAG TPA: nitrous oxide reductase accessory protein NosL [Oscillatoriaceae cyanobacterium]